MNSTIEDRDPIDGVAIIGMVGRFPGANSVDELWQNLCQGIESTTFFADRELDPSIDPQLIKNPHYIKARGIIADGECFDADFFGINPSEAEVIDPQSRIFLELVVAALETAGYAGTFDGLIGLYAGCSQNTYFTNHLAGRQDILDRIGDLPMMFAREKDYMTMRASYNLDLKGPSIGISTSCSTSLVAITQAVQALTNYQCDLAVTGAVSMLAPQHTGYLYQEDSIFSHDGHCRPFDARAQGTIFSNGGGVVVLKRVEEALADGDRIYAVIRGVGINNDGGDKVSFSAPSVDGQAQAIAMAQAHADVSPESITYVEAHGTATPMGDPIEVAALTQAFRLQTAANQFCAIGSIKGNIGHLADAAGIAGLIKVALALDHQQIPPSINFETPNPQLDLANSPFYVNTKLADWLPGSSPRRAGVSSFGFGGTNVHLVLEEAPPVRPSGGSRRHQLLLISAKTRMALATATSNLQAHLASHPQIDLADVAHTLRRGRKEYNYRSFVVCHDSAQRTLRVGEACALRLRDDAIQALVPDKLPTRAVKSRSREVVFMFPGQGSQYVNMGVNFYQDEPVFREIVDHCAEILQPLMGVDLRSIVYPAAEAAETAAVDLAQTFLTQPALFVTEYALAKLWQSWGVQPQAMIGHSIGEFVAACLAGVFSLDDALLLVATRGRLMWDLPRGSMLSVQLPAAAIVGRLSPDLAIAAINSPSLCVVSGAATQIATMQAQLESEEISCRLLHTSHAFHSGMMDSIVEPFAQVVNRVQLSPPQIPFVSTVTGDWITDAQAIDPNYWANHLRQTVQFAQGIQTIWQQPERVLLEVGPRTTTATLARQQTQDLQQQVAISSLGSDSTTEWTGLLAAVGQLWSAGVSIDWDSFESLETRSRIPLPTYPFERKRFWIDPLPHADLTQPIPRLDLDPQALPAPESRAESAPKFLAARDEVEVELTKIWQRVLGVRPIGITDNFFELGGHSLLAIRLFAEIERVWGKNFPLATLFQAQTIEQLANLLRKEEWTAPSSSLVQIQSGGNKAPLFCIHPIGGNVLEYYRLAHYLGAEQPVYGLQSLGLDGKKAPLESIEAMASHYISEMQIVQPHGPYRLVGYSFAGLVVYEIAQQLHLQGETVDLLVLLDRISPNFVPTRPSLFESLKVHLTNLRRLNTRAKLKYLLSKIGYKLVYKGDYRAYMIGQWSEALSIEYINVFDANLQASKDYQSQFYPGKVTLFRCEVQPPKQAVATTLGWNSSIVGDLEIHHIPGNHSEILRENVKSVAQTIKLCLEKI
jgi:acyl transferase domain-containing protein/thioesterase domain-containing protein